MVISSIREYYIYHSPWIRVLSSAFYQIHFITNRSRFSSRANSIKWHSWYIIQYVHHIVRTYMTVLVDSIYLYTPNCIYTKYSNNTLKCKWLLLKLIYQSLFGWTIFYQSLRIKITVLLYPSWRYSLFNYKYYMILNYVFLFY